MRAVRHWRRREAVVGGDRGPRARRPFPTTAPAPGYEVPDSGVERFDPDDALAFYIWLRARDAISVRGGGWVERRLREQHRTGCPMQQARIEATGFDLAALGWS